MIRITFEVLTQTNEQHIIDKEFSTKKEAFLFYKELKVYKDCVIKHISGEGICTIETCFNPLHLCFSCGEDNTDLVHPTFAHDFIYDCAKCRKSGVVGSTGNIVQNDFSIMDKYMIQDIENSQYKPTDYDIAFNNKAFKVMNKKVTR